ncbi:MAG: S49 family peptidase [Rhodocyclaceae bacterium]|nr:S49 family peptidase [Rhodocyclaceae bacterium]
MLPHLASRLFGTPLLVHRAKLDVILAAIGHRLDIQAPAVELALPSARAVPSAPSGIAVIPIHGTLVKRTLGLEAASGLMSYAEIGAHLEAAMGDPQVAGIVLDIDSPGGETGGCFELARRVREATAVKPIWAVANDAAFSAAYAIAAAAQRVIVTETGGVGSIGVIALHVDQSLKDANDGYRYTAIKAGRHKNDFSPHEPLTDTAKGELQAEVDRLYDIFVGHVAAMRGLPEMAVRATEAALYFGPNATAAGLADAVGTLDATLTEFSTYLSSRGRKAPPARSFARHGATHLQEDDMSLEETQMEMIGVDQAAVLVAEARREVAQSAQAIAELCLIAGCPDKAAAFIAEGKSEADVRRVLCEDKAARSEATPIHSTITPDAGTEAPERPEASPVVAAVKKLIHKE